MTSPKLRRMLAAGFLAAASLTGGACASNLKVKKVPVADRASCTDHQQQGFRYYLNRPYLVVKKPILVSETVSLVRVTYPAASGAVGAAPVNPADAQVTFLDGPRRGRTVRAGDLQFEAPGSGAMRTARPEELQAIRVALEAAGSQRQGAVVPVQGQIVATENGVSVPAADATLASAAPGTQPGAALADTSTADLALPTVTTGDKFHSPALQGDMEIVYLPDLDEQYVIKSRNSLAKSAFGLAFRNGGELVEVQGEHDSTTVSLALLNQVQNAIGTAKDVEVERIKQQAKVLKAEQAKPGEGTKADLGNRNQQPVWQLTERAWIKPGVYRLNKPWEADCGPGLQPVGCGLLAKLGLPTVVSVDYTPVATITK